MEHLEKDNFETEYGVSGMVRERRKSYEPVFTRGIAIGVVLCILSVIPIILAGAYWCLATAIYLGWSFWTSRWEFTWIIWPVAGVLYAAVFGIIRWIMSNKETAA